MHIDIYGWWFLRFSKLRLLGFIPRIYYQALPNKGKFIRVLAWKYAESLETKLS